MPRRGLFGDQVVLELWLSWNINLGQPRLGRFAINGNVDNPAKELNICIYNIYIYIINVYIINVYIYTCIHTEVFTYVYCSIHRLFFFRGSAIVIYGLVASALVYFAFSNLSTYI